MDRSGDLAPTRPAPSDPRPAVLAAIAVGGALGTLLRDGVAQLVHVAPATFPWATFATNVTGSLLLGVLLTLVLERWPPTRYVRPFAAIGVLGSYTTFSTFSVEAALLVRAGRPELAVAYVAASLAAGSAAVFAGVRVARTRPTVRGGR